MSLEKISLFGFHFISASTVKEVADEIINNLNIVSKGQHDFLITPNAYQLVHYNDPANVRLREFYERSAYILPDGMPVIWISHLLKNRLKSRLAGSDFFPGIWKEIKDRQLRATFILPNESMSALFRKESPICNCFVPEIFEKNDETYIDVFAEKTANGIISNSSRFVFLGLGFPKQELLAMRLSEKLTEKGYDQQVLFLLLGASFEFYFGMKKRAPAFIQKSGMEWLYRFAKEPRRLWKRYTIDNMRFLGLVIREIMK